MTSNYLMCMLLFCINIKKGVPFIDTPFQRQLLFIFYFNLKVSRNLVV